MCDTFSVTRQFDTFSVDTVDTYSGPTFDTFSVDLTHLAVLTHLAALTHLAELTHLAVPHTSSIKLRTFDRKGMKRVYSNTHFHTRITAVMVASKCRTLHQ